MLTVEVIDDLGAAEALAPEWDELAVARSIPMCAPGWMLAWWRNLAPAGAGLRIVVVRNGSELMAIAPWFVQSGEAGRVDVRFLGAELSDRVDVLCLPGREPRSRPSCERRCLKSSHAPTSPPSRRYPSAHRGRVFWRTAGAGGPGLGDTETPSSPLPRSPCPRALPRLGSRGAHATFEARSVAWDAGLRASAVACAR